MNCSSVRLTGWELVADDGTVSAVQVPGTVTQAYPDALDADLREWVFRTVLADVPPGPVDLVLEGVATSYEVVLDGTTVLRGRSMHEAHTVDVTSLAHQGCVLEIRCLPLATALPDGKPPRARWRSRLVEDNSLRLIRTTLLGRCPGIAPGPPVVGPYRPVSLQTRRPAVSLSATLDGTTGVLTVTGEGTFSCAGVTGTGELRIPDVPLWWPHTHGTPVLHDVARTLNGVSTIVGRVGFRSVVNACADSLDLVVNGVPIWARGAVWTPPGLMAGIPEQPDETVLLARDAGMNLLRVPGTAPYESAAFLAACDELGVLVWHDLALANLDVPHDLLGLDGELTSLLDLASGHPSFAVLCGGSETAQQVAMLGLDPELWRSDFLDRRAPALVGDRALWIGNTPLGGALPFRMGTGIAHWFGVGGYRRPPCDTRLSAVTFAAECLAFANPTSAADGWTPRDNGADWDFADVREHYATSLHRPSEAVAGELMSGVFEEWRRAGSPNRGGLVLWLRDLQPGAGWGLLSSDGIPKQPWWHLRRSLAPQAIWLTDEGLDGVAVHLANDTPTPWDGSLRLSLYRDDDLRLEEVSVPLSVPAHGDWVGDVEGLVGRFLDVSFAYRFGTPSVATVVATFEDGSVSPRQGFLFPLGRPTAPQPRSVLAVQRDGEVLSMTSSRVLDGVRLRGPGLPSDNHFCLEPHRPRLVSRVVGDVRLTAHNLEGSVKA